MSDVESEFIRGQVFEIQSDIDAHEFFSDKIEMQ